MFVIQEMIDEADKDGDGEVSEAGIPQNYEEKQTCTSTHIPHATHSYTYTLPLSICHQCKCDSDTHNVIYVCTYITNT